MFLRVWRIFIFFLGVWLLIAPADLAWARNSIIEHPELAKALAYYERGNYARAADELESLMNGASTGEPLNGLERERALEALGISRYILGNLQDARRSFTDLYRVNASYQPDALYIPPEIVAFIVDVRRSSVPAAQPVTAPSQQIELQLRESQASGPSYDERRAVEFSALDLLPFGVGQFRRGYTVRGSAFAALETLFLGANIGLYYYRTCALKTPCSETWYPEDKLKQARNMQTLQIVSGSLFIATAVFGIADGLSLPLQTGGATLKPMPSGMGVSIPLD